MRAVAGDVVRAKRPVSLRGRVPKRGELPPIAIERARAGIAVHERAEARGRISARVKVHGCRGHCAGEAAERAIGEGDRNHERVLALKRQDLRIDAAAHGRRCRVDERARLRVVLAHGECHGGARCAEHLLCARDARHEHKLLGGGDVPSVVKVGRACVVAGHVADNVRDASYRHPIVCAVRGVLPRDVAALVEDAARGARAGHAVVDGVVTRGVNNDRLIAQRERGDGCACVVQGRRRRLVAVAFAHAAGLVEAAVNEIGELRGRNAPSVEALVDTAAKVGTNDRAFAWFLSFSHGVTIPKF